MIDHALIVDKAFLREERLGGRADVRTTHVKVISDNKMTLADVCSLSAQAYPDAVAFSAFRKWRAILGPQKCGEGAKLIRFYFFNSHFAKLIYTTFTNDFLGTALKFMQTTYSLNLNILNINT